MFGSRAGRTRNTGLIGKGKEKKSGRAERAMGMWEKTEEEVGDPHYLTISLLPQDPRVRGFRIVRMDSRDCVIVSLRSQ